jgi:DNA-binding CsgD family transcriptional regulator
LAVHGRADLETIANELGVSIHTARVQIKHVMEKTGTKRQVELMRVLLKASWNLQVISPMAGSLSKSSE